jgi:hypothetical protein
VRGDRVFLLDEVVVLQARDDHAPDNQRSRRIAESFLRIGDLDVPDLLPRAHLEGDDPRVGGVQVDLVLVDREAPDLAAYRRQLGLVPELPQQIAGRRVERLDDAVRAGHVHDAVVDDRRRDLASRIHRPLPRKLELVHVAAGDFLERAVSPAVVGATPVEPVVSARLPEHLVGDGPHVAQDRFDLGDLRACDGNAHHDRDEGDEQADARHRVSLSRTS